MGLQVSSGLAKVTIVNMLENPILGYSYNIKRTDYCFSVYTYMRLKLLRPCKICLVYWAN